MPKYAYAGEFNTCPEVRELLDRIGAELTSIATIDNVIQVETAAPVDHADLALIVEA